MIRYNEDGTVDLDTTRFTLTTHVEALPRILADALDAANAKLRSAEQELERLRGALQGMVDTVCRDIDGKQMVLTGVDKTTLRIARAALEHKP